jgi:two-component system OmpR family response regulator
MRLLLLEDDITLGEAVRDYLEGEGHVVDWFKLLRDVRGLERQPYDAMLVDWNLPDGSGMDWIVTLRRSSARVPVIMLTARDLLNDRVRGLDAGADDYLVKPFDLEELVARVRAVCRRSGDTNAQCLRYGDLEIDLEHHVIRINGQPQVLTAREWQITEALALRAGRALSRTDLETILLGFSAELNSNAVEVHISSIRRKFGRDILETIRGVGYIMKLPTP